MKYLLTPNGYLFQSKIELDISKLAEGTQVFDTEKEMYTAYCDKHDMEYDEVEGCHYTIINDTQYCDDRGGIAPFNEWENSPMPTPETFLNNFVM